MNWCRREPKLKDMLSDSIVQAVMEADGVDARSSRRCCARSPAIQDRPRPRCAGVGGPRRIAMPVMAAPDGRARPAPARFQPHARKAQWSGSRPRAEDDAEIVGRHRDALHEIQSVPTGERANLAEIAHAPSRIVGPQAGVEARVARRRVAAVLLERPVKIEHAGGREHPRGARHQPFRRRPRRDVDQVDRDHGIRPADGPARRAGIELERRQQVGQVARPCDAPRCSQAHRHHLAGLPSELGQSGGEMHRMLAGAARDLQHVPARGQEPAQHREDRLAVASRPPAKSGRLVRKMSSCRPLARRNSCCPEQTHTGRRVPRRSPNIAGISRKTRRERCSVLRCDPKAAANDARIGRQKWTDVRRGEKIHSDPLNPDSAAIEFRRLPA